MTERGGRIRNGLHGVDRVSRRAFLGTTAGGAAAALAGCTGKSDSGGDRTTTESTDATSETTETTQSGSDAASSATIALSMDPTMEVWNVYGGVMPYYTNVLEPLVWVADDMTLQPWLAESWEATGKKTWEFTLREDVQFHNGDPLTAETVAWSFEQVVNEWSYGTDWLHLEPDAISVLDDRTVEFETTDQFPTFPGTIAHNMVAVQHPDRSREDHEVIGTGPYRVTDREQGQHVKVAAFDEYWNQAPDTPKLTFRVISDANTRGLALESGEVDVAFDPPTNQLGSMQSNESIDVTTKLAPRAGFAGLNVYRSPTDDVKLRRALNYAVSQELIVEEVLNGVGKPARGPIAESIYWSAHDDLPEYGPDVEKARRLVEESSYDGETLTLIAMNDRPVGSKLIAQVLQQAASDIGVSVDIRMLEHEAYDEAHRGGEAHVAITELGTNSGAADYVIHDIFHSKGSLNKRQWQADGTGVYNLGDEVDGLIEQGMTTGDQATKEEAYGTALQTVMDQGVVIPLYYGEYVVGAQSGVEGMDLRAIAQMSRWTGLDVQQ
ncbi:ABC transporter substrate-binding protein [Halobacteriaceae archaeon GCM10025711]